jgi:hypothetical protein
MKGKPVSFAELVEGVNRGTPGIANHFHEYCAMITFQECCGLNLSWHGRRWGDDKADEPDFVVEDGGKIVAGFEMTEVESPEVRQHNAMLARMVEGKPLHRPKDPEKRQAMLEREARVERTYAIVASDASLEKIQQFWLRLSGEALAALIAERLEAKKRKTYHLHAEYPVHLVVYERGYILCEGSKANALCLAGEHDKGNFAGVWYLEDDGKLTRL